MHVVAPHNIVQIEHTPPMGPIACFNKELDEGPNTQQQTRTV